MRIIVDIVRCIDRRTHIFLQNARGTARRLLDEGPTEEVNMTYKTWFQKRTFLAEAEKHLECTLHISESRENQHVP